LTVMPRSKHEAGIHATEKVFSENCFTLTVSPLTPERLLDALTKFEEEKSEVFSHPLAVCLILLRDFIKEHRLQFEAMVNHAGDYIANGQLR
jgi:hypothetical protein